VSAQSNKFTNRYTIIFMAVVCIVSGTVLAFLATMLREPQAAAAELDRNKQIMIAAKLYHPEGYFLLRDQSGQFLPGKWDQASQRLIPGSVGDNAKAEELLKVSHGRIKACLVDHEGTLSSFAEAKINEKEYLQDNAKLGYARLPQKLIYLVADNDPTNTEPVSYILPVNGTGLWDSIYGYLAVDRDGETIIGTTWYKHAETAGLGANIALPSWQAQFYGKKIFQPNGAGVIDHKNAPMGITVVKGKVKDVLGDAPQAIAAVDGIAGSTLTGNGVGSAYKDSVTPYRQFFIKVNQAYTSALNKPAVK
jgi:Na+-transporting NADH:ubiquinone oxidoreductase subunit C